MQTAAVLEILNFNLLYIHKKADDFYTAHERTFAQLQSCNVNC